MPHQLELRNLHREAGGSCAPEHRDCPLPQLVIVRDNGTMYWEEGGNRVAEVPEEGADGVLEVICEFGDTSKTAATFIDADTLDAVRPSCSSKE